MKRMLALLLVLMLPALTACGTTAEERGGEEVLSRDSIQEEMEEPREEPDLDLAVCQPEEAFRELEHMNSDPTGYRGLCLRLTGELSVYQDHGKAFYYIGVRDEDGCIENLELRFPGDGSLPKGFPAAGQSVTVWGRVELLSVQREGETLSRPVLSEARLSQYIFDGRD